MRLSRRGRIVVITFAFFVVEWLLFELVRLPYRPPHDMRTFLGQEKDLVPGLMGTIAVGWLLYVVCDGLRPLPAVRDAIAFAAMFCVLLVVAATVVFYPPWPVTPFNLLFQ